MKEVLLKGDLACITLHRWFRDWISAQYHLICLHTGPTGMKLQLLTLKVTTCALSVLLWFRKKRYCYLQSIWLIKRCVIVCIRLKLWAATFRLFNCLHPLNLHKYCLFWVSATNHNTSWCHPWNSYLYLFERTLSKATHATTTPTSPHSLWWPVTCPEFFRVSVPPSI